MGFSRFAGAARDGALIPFVVVAQAVRRAQQSMVIATIVAARAPPATRWRSVSTRSTPAVRR